MVGYVNGVNTGWVIPERVGDTRQFSRKGYNDPG